MRDHTAALRHCGYNRCFENCGYIRCSGRCVIIFDVWAQMLSLLCPFLVAVRIFADMLMPLEMRFQFDGREYGNENLRVPERLEVDDVEDTNDPQQGPVAVIEGWRLVASTCIIQSGWVPDNHVQARGLLVAGEVVNRFMLKFKNCLLYTSPSPRDMRRSRMPSSA